MNQYLKAYFKGKLATWYEYVDKHDKEGHFSTVKNTFKDHHDRILNYFFAGFSNPRAEALNSKIKDFRHRLRGVKSLTFFFYRIEKLLV